MDEVTIMKRILHIVGKMDRAGAETMLMNLYRNINRELIQFDFITFTEDKGDYDDEILKLGGKIIPIVASNPIQRMLKLAHYLKHHPEYEVVHAHMLLSNSFHLLAAKQAGIRHRISHSHNTSNGQSTYIKKIYEYWALYVNRKLATYKIACGIEAARYLFGTEEDVLILTNAIDIDKITEEAKATRDYIDTTNSKEKLNIVQVGRLNTVKNHAFSLEIAKELKKRDVEFTLYIIGQGPLKSKLENEVSNHGLDDSVKFLGVRDDVTKIMASSDYMIMPSLHEGFPVVLIESQASGLPALISDRISTEVDLGLGLVKFLPIDNVNLWAESLQKDKVTNLSSQLIKMKLQRSGFDIKQNAQRISNTYLNFLD